MDTGIDVVVVGGGIIGACTALYLQQAGKNTLLVDQYPVGHSEGSSGGLARITRLANFGPPQLTPIMDDARTRWTEIANLVHEELVSPAPLLVVGTKREGVEKMAQSVEKTGHKPNWITPKQTNDKYKTRFTEDFVMFEDLSAGVMKADRCHAAVIRLFKAKGGRIMEGWKVEELLPGTHGRGTTLRGPHGTIRAPKLVLCLGPWAPSFLRPLGIDLPLQSLKTKALLYRNAGFPHASFVDVSPANYMYGLSAMDSEGAMVKVGCHEGAEMNPGSSGGDLSYLEVKVKPYMNRYMPLGQLVGEETCWYTESPDKEFVIDRNPEHPDILYAAGFTGTGFKTAPTIGHILSCLVTGEQHGFDLSPFAADRFRAKSRL